LKALDQFRRWQRWFTFMTPTADLLRVHVVIAVSVLLSSIAVWEARSISIEREPEPIEDLYAFVQGQGSQTFLAVHESREELRQQVVAWSNELQDRIESRDALLNVGPIDSSGVTSAERSQRLVQDESAIDSQAVRLAELQHELERLDALAALEQADFGLTTCDISEEDDLRIFCPGRNFASAAPGSATIRYLALGYLATFLWWYRVKPSLWVMPVSGRGLWHYASITTGLLALALPGILMHTVIYFRAAGGIVPASGWALHPPGFLFSIVCILWWAAIVLWGIRTRRYWLLHFSSVSVLALPASLFFLAFSVLEEGIESWFLVVSALLISVVSNHYILRSGFWRFSYSWGSFLLASTLLACGALVVRASPLPVEWERRVAAVGLVLASIHLVVSRFADDGLFRLRDPRSW
jgi:hypothetical protein